MITLYPHQVAAIEDEARLRAEDPQVKNTLVVLPTGAGKSLTMADYALNALQKNEITIIFAHRDVLISQLSEALCRTGVPHTFICSDKARNEIRNRNYIKFGDTFWSETSPVIISSNPTFASRVKSGKIPQSLLNRVKWWLQDEAHHCLKESQTWGSCISALPNAKGVGFTATPLRNDKKGLGSHVEGFFDAMSVTTTMWDLIKAGKLSPYKVFQPPENLVSREGLSSGKEDYNQKEAANRVNNIEVTGNAVEHYLAVSPGKPAITFCQNIDHARLVAREFNNAGVRSVVVSSKDSLEHRDKAMKDFASGLIHNLVNVDLLGEGYDCPSVTTVIMLRITKSYSLFKQQFGRMLRTADGKAFGILLDHVGNVNYMRVEYGLNDIHDDPEWTLDRYTKRASNDDGEKLENFIRCMNTEPLCGIEFKMSDTGGVCPECGWSESVEEREARLVEVKLSSTDDKLVELKSDVIELILNKRNEVDLPMEEFSKKVQHMHGPAKHGAKNNHAKRQHAQIILRDLIQKWCIATAMKTGWSKKVVQAEFQRKFKVDVYSAQILTERQTNELIEKMQGEKVA